MSTPQIITVISGDGIGPEITEATIEVLHVAGANLVFEYAAAGESVVNREDAVDGVPIRTLESIAANKVALKGPLGTPLGGGARSSNVALRKAFDLYGNIRPARELQGVVTPFSGKGINLTVVRENLEDLYIGVEHQLTEQTHQSLKVMTEAECERIVHLAFATAQKEGKNRVTCATKANILKSSEGLLKRVFEEIAPQYPDIEANHLIIDNCAHQLVRFPEHFGVLVTSNMNGDIISDLTAGLVGGLGLAASANIGENVAIFEAVHGTAPDIAGKGIANPTALLQAAVMMLRHLDMLEPAAKIEYAIETVLAQGVHTTGDLGGSATTVEYVAALCDVIRNVDEQTVQARLGQSSDPTTAPALTIRSPRKVAEVGVDVFFEVDSKTAEEYAAIINNALNDSVFELVSIKDRGQALWTRAGSVGGKRQLSDNWCAMLTADAFTDEDLQEALTHLFAVLKWTQFIRLREFS